MRSITKLSLFIFFLCLFGICSHAAEFSIQKGTDGKPDLIAMTGEIFKGDEIKFRVISAASDAAIVSLDSPGGDLYPALTIGKLIHAMGYYTNVSKGAECNSSCALIWLAGQYKYLAKDSAIGFHEIIDCAPTKDAVRKMQRAYALVGAYLQSLGIREGAIYLMLDFSEKPVNWLTWSNARLFGISLVRAESLEPSN